MQCTELLCKLNFFSIKFSCQNILKTPFVQDKIQIYHSIIQGFSQDFPPTSFWLHLLLFCAMFPGFQTLSLCPLSEHLLLYQAPACVVFFLRISSNLPLLTSINKYFEFFPSWCEYENNVCGPQARLVQGPAGSRSGCDPGSQLGIGPGLRMSR